ncbi:hypothetical protein NLU14_22650, partial [Marinobacter sp. 71-i]
VQADELGVHRDGGRQASYRAQGELGNGAKLSEIDLFAFFGKRRFIVGCLPPTVKAAFFWSTLLGYDGKIGLLCPIGEREKIS